MEIVLYEPEIPPNTGNIARLCVCTGTSLHIVGEPKFSLDESAVKRAGLDYWDKLNLHLHKDWPSFLEVNHEKKIWLLSRFATKTYSDISFDSTDMFVFGSESKGLPEEISSAHSSRLLRIPVHAGCRSLNLSNSVAIVLYEALRQMDFMNCSKSI